MNKTFSLYLDVVRLLAAFAVFASHAPSFAGGWFWQLSSLGHEAVVIFFVLSGYVIAYVLYDKKETAHHYMVNRFVRIMSVALPALALTLLLYFLAKSIEPSAVLDAEQRMGGHPWWIILLRGLTFTNQNWQAMSMFTNLPYWSMAYEVWYYVFFGLAFFLRGAVKWLTLILALVIMGPSIVLYLPIWFLGVFCFKFGKRVALGVKASWLGASLSLFIVMLLCFENVQHSINEPVLHSIGSLRAFILEPAHYFASDYLLALSLTAHFYFVYQLSRHSDKVPLDGKNVKRIIRLSGHTFALYLFHMPMFYFIKAVLPYEVYTYWNLLACWVVVPVVIVLISEQIESRKQVFRQMATKLMYRKCAKT